MRGPAVVWLIEAILCLLLIFKVVGTPQDLHECAPGGFEIPDSLALFYVTFRIKGGGLNRSMQHWLAVYLLEFQSPMSFVGVD